MVVLQTTNSVFDTKLYDHVTPASLLAWQRVRVANMVANNGAQWSNLLAKYNSGKKDPAVLSYMYVVYCVILSMHYMHE